MLIISRTFLCLMFLSVSACASSSAEPSVLSKNESVEMPKEKQPKIKKTWQQVTVKFLNFEGGFYGLVSEKGAKLLPINLPSKYKIDGAVLRVKGQPINNMMTIQQWGKPFKVIDIELIKEGVGKQSTH